MRRGDIFWADLGEPIGSEPGYKRPILIIQADHFNNSKLATVIVLSLTSNMDLRSIPGCAFLSSRETGLPKDSIANATQLRTLDRSRIENNVGQLDDETMLIIDNALKNVLGL